MKPKRLEPKIEIWSHQHQVASNCRGMLEIAQRGQMTAIPEETSMEEVAGETERMAKVRKRGVSWKPREKNVSA